MAFAKLLILINNYQVLPNFTQFYPILPNFAQFLLNLRMNKRILLYCNKLIKPCGQSRAKLLSRGYPSYSYTRSYLRTYVTNNHMRSTQNDNTNTSIKYNNNNENEQDSHTYRVLTPLEYNTFINMGLYYGNQQDMSKGYIRLCKNHEELKKVILKHYNNKIIYICKLANTELSSLKYYKDLNGIEHPCLFQTLNTKSMIKAIKLNTDANNYMYYYKMLDELNKYI